MAAQYSYREELTHSGTHGLGVLLSIAGMTLILIRASQNNDAWQVLSGLIYGCSLIALYLSSTIYHALPQGKRKVLLRRVDHAIIYVMIAGSYTPITLTSLRDDYGWLVFSSVWLLAVAGLYLELVAKKSYRKVAIALYLGMGWLILLAIKPLSANFPSNGITLLVAGGLFYSVGVLFYLRKSMPYHHLIWHLFVMAGSVLHYLAYLFYIYP